MTVVCRSDFTSNFLISYYEPCSISWDYNILGDVTIDEYETTRPPRRNHFEMVLPRKVRTDMLLRDWDLTSRQLADAVRRNVKAKNQRKATVNNLGKATKLEESCPISVCSRNDYSK